MSWSMPTGRAAFIRAVVALPVSLVPRDSAAAAACSDSLQTIINTALAAERLATTFYYAALTSKELMSDSQLGGSSTDPNHPGTPPNGTPGNVRFLQAALDSELKHAQALIQAGASAAFKHFYFPANTFKVNCAAGQLCTLGRSDDAHTFLGVLEVLETAFVGAYLAAVRQFVELGHPQLAETATNIVGVEAEHRALGRVIADARPPNNLTLERLPFACVSDAAGALAPFLTGKGFVGGATAPISLPSDSQVARVVGQQHTHILSGAYL